MAILKSTVFYAILLSLTACSEPDPLPPILRGAQAESGRQTSCPNVKHPEIYKGVPDGPSPNVTLRLKKRFEVGSSDNEITYFLKRQGFKISVCKSDGSIHGYAYRNTRTVSLIQWKVISNRMVWIKGYVSHSSL